MNVISNNGSGQHVVFIHGNSLSSTIWELQIDAPGSKHLDLRAIDLHGHGASPRNAPDRPYSLDGFASEVAGYLNDLDDVVLVGHSLGGHIAMRVLPKAPNVRGLMLLGAPPLASVADMALAFHPTPALANAFKPDLTEADARVSAETFLWKDGPWVERITQMILAADPRVRGDIGREIMAGTLADEQGLIRASGVPVCMVHGSEEPSVSLDHLRGISGLFWKHKVHVIDGAAHCPQIERPDAFNGLLAEFASSL